MNKFINSPLCNSEKSLGTDSKNKKQKISQIITSVLVLLLIMFEPKTHISTKFISSTMAIGILLVGLIIINIIFSDIWGNPLKRINSSSFLMAGISVVCILGSKIIHIDTSNYYILLVEYILLAYIFTVIIPVEKFIDAYVTVMVFLAIYSLVVTYSIILSPSSFSFLPVFEHQGSSYYEGRINFINALFCNVYIPDYGIQYRNYGLFTEPGAYQFYLLLGLVFEIFFKKKSSSLLVLILTVAMFSTFSPVAIISGIILNAVYYFIKINTFNAKNLIVIIGYIVTLIVLYNIEFVNDTLLKEMTKLYGGGSLDSRYGSFVGYLMAWLEKPIFGWGYTGGVSGGGSKYLSDFTEHNTSTLCTNLAFFGIVYGTLHPVGVFMFIKKYSKNIGYVIIGFVLVMFSMNTQRFIDSTVVFIMIFYGYMIYGRINMKIKS